MKRVSLLAAVVFLSVLAGAFAASPAGAKVVNENTDDLPPGCEEVSEEVELTVRGGTEFASEFEGTVFTFEQRSWDVAACARVTVTFINTDPIRHQFMIHGTYPNGSTLIELPGEGQDTATWIAPSSATSLMVHCGVNQHQQKGMKAQFLVDGGDGDVPNIPGISGLPAEDDPHVHEHGEGDDRDRPTPGPGAGLALVGLVCAGLAARLRTR